MRKWAGWFSHGIWLRLSRLLEGCTFHLQTLSCRIIPSDKDIIPFLYTQRATLYKLCIRTDKEEWPALAQVICCLTNLKVLKVYSNHRLFCELPIKPLLSNQLRIQSFYPRIFKEDIQGLIEFLAGQTQIRFFDEGPLPSVVTLLRTMIIGGYRLTEVLALRPNLERLSIEKGGMYWDEHIQNLIRDQLGGLRALRLFVGPVLGCAQIIFLLDSTPELRYLHLGSTPLFQVRQPSVPSYFASIE